MKRSEKNIKKISRRKFLETSVIGGAAAATFPLTASASKTRPVPGILKKRTGSPSHPNIVYIFADQLRYTSLGSSGNKLVRTPYLDQLADEGVVLDQAFSSCPICSPYRAQIITGRYSHKNGVMDNEYKLHDDQVIIHQVLKRAGYKTAHIGKWHLGYGPYTEDKRYGLDYMFAHDCDHRYYNTTYYENERGPVKTHGWSPEIETSKAMEFIEDHCRGSGGLPFSVYLSFAPPHNNVAYYYNRGHLPYDMYPGEFNVHDPAKVELRPNVPIPLADFARSEIADYYGNVASLDAQVGRLMAKLEELGLADNTILCFTSDHGDHLRSHGYGCPGDRWLHHTKRANKATPHEEAIHIPFIIRYPDVLKEGSHTRTLFSSVDVMPTLLGMCGLEIPDGVQGKDLSHAVKGDKGDEPDSVYLQILGPGWPHRGKWVGYWRGLRTDRWLYARWHNPEQYEYGIWLFDREKDPFEMNNLAGKKDHSETERNLEARLQKWMSETDDPFDTGERDPETGMLLLGQEFTHEKYYR
jgi:arylsulfatase A-like enzyme